MPNSVSPANPASSNTTSQHSQSTQDTDTVSTSDRVNQRIDIEYEGDRYYAQSATYLDGTYTAVYQDGQLGQGDPQFGRVTLQVPEATNTCCVLCISFVSSFDQHK